MVLGTHMMDLMRFFVGEATWAVGQISERGREVTSANGRPGPEEIGPIAGDALIGVYGFASGAHGYFEPHRSMPAARRRHGMEIYGTTGILCLASLGAVLWYPLPGWDPADTQAGGEDAGGAGSGGGEGPPRRGGGGGGADVERGGRGGRTGDDPGDLRVALE